MTDKVKDIVQEAHELARQASALMDDVYNLIVDLDDGDIDEGAFQEVKDASLAAYSARCDLGTWLMNLTPDDDEQESESAPASP
jgi:hypothetical protein